MGEGEGPGPRATHAARSNERKVPGLNQKIQHIIKVTVIATGAPVTGLVTADFTALIRRLASPPGGDLVTDAAVWSVTEIDAGVAPGLYTYEYQPATATGRHRNDLATVNAAYQIDLPVWEDDVSGGSALSTGPYLTTRDNVKLARALTGAADDQRIDALLASVTAWAQTYCDRTFFEATYTDQKNGLDYDRLVLDETPVSSITSVHQSTAWPRAYGASELLVLDTDYLLEDADAGIIAKASGRFPEGPRTIKVVYVAGYPTIPSDLEWAAIVTIHVRLDRAKHGLYHIASENRGDGQIAFSSAIRDPDVPFDAKRTFDAHRRMRGA